MNEEFWRADTPLRTTDDAENMTTEDPEYIPELAMEDEDRGWEKTPMDNRAFQRRAVAAEHLLTQEKRKNKEAKRQVRSYEAHLREAQSNGKLVSDTEADRLIQELMDENKKSKCVIGTLEMVIQMLHEGACRHVCASQIKDNCRPA
jgi:hypothetical protein